MPGNNFIYVYKIFLSYLIITLLNLPSTEPFSPPQSPIFSVCVCARVCAYVCMCNRLSVIRWAVLGKITLVTLAKKVTFSPPAAIYWQCFFKEEWGLRKSPRLQWNFSSVYHPPPKVMFHSAPPHPRGLRLFLSSVAGCILSLGGGNVDMLFDYFEHFKQSCFSAIVIITHRKQKLL